MHQGGGEANMQALLREAHWVFPDSGTHMHAFIHGELSARGLDIPDKLIESRSTSAIRWLVQNTDFLALSTSIVHMPELLTGDVQKVETDWIFPITKHVLYRRPRHTMSRSALQFVDAIKTEAKRQQKGFG